ncbi:MAG: hypothetical protein KC492_40690, partial [Myxococcales bacterium]|nr:hypothetical protein [Myxococcales bacterium]
VLTCLREQVESRLRNAGPRSVDGLLQLYGAAPPPARDAIRQAISAVEISGDWLAPVLDLAVELADHALEESLMASMPAASLARWLARQIHDRPSNADSLRHRALELALNRRSPELAFAAWAGDSPRGLAAAASLVERHPDAAPNFEVLLAEQPDEQQLAWCLDCPVEALQDLAVRHAAERFGASRLPPARIAERCEGHRLGAAIFVRACPSLYEHELTGILQGHPILALDLVVLSLKSASSPSAITKTAIRVTPSERLWSPALHTALAVDSVSRNFGSLQVLVQRLLSDLATNSVDPEEAGVWLATPAIASALRAATSWDIERPFVNRSPDLLHRVIRATARVRDLSTDPGTVRPLGLLLARAWGDQIAQNIPALLTLLPVPVPADQGDLLLRAEVFGTLRHAPPEGAWILAERCFHPVYTSILNNSPILTLVTWRSSLRPNAAKYCRHWLLDTWCERRWPTESFITSLANDRALAERVFKRAAKVSRTTQAFLLALGRPLRAHPELWRVWADIVS